jgi:LacI family transcriptional regulator
MIGLDLSWQKRFMTAHHNVSLRDIAKEAGVSLATVSYAMNNSPRVSRATQKRIQRVALEMGYRRNPMVATLLQQVRSGKLANYSETVAFPTFFERPDLWRSLPFVVEQFEGAKQTGHEYGYELEPVWFGEAGMSPRRMSQILTNRGIRGILLPPLPQARAMLDFPWDVYHSVALGYSLTEPCLHRAVAHPMQAVRHALIELKAKGYRSPVFLTSDEMEDRTENLFSIGWNFYYEKIYGGQGHIVVMDSGADELRETFLAEVARSEADVVVSFPADAPKWLAEAGYRVPRDISYVTLNKTSPKLAGIDQHWRHVASVGMNFLITLLQGNQPPGVPKIPMLIKAYSSWSDGPTVCAPDQRGAPAASTRSV